MKRLTRIGTCLLAGLLLLAAAPNAVAGSPPDQYDKVIYPITAATWDPSHTWGLDPNDPLQMQEIIAKENLYELYMAFSSVQLPADLYYASRQAWDPVAGAPVFGGKVLLKATDATGAPAVFDFTLRPGWYYFASFYFGTANPQYVIRHPVQIYGETVNGHMTTIKKCGLMDIYNFGPNAYSDLPSWKFEGIRFDGTVVAIRPYSVDDSYPGLTYNLNFEVRDCEFVNGTGYDVLAYVAGKVTLVGSRFDSLRGPSVIATSGTLDAEISGNDVHATTGWGIAFARAGWQPHVGALAHHFRIADNTVHVAGGGISGITNRSADQLRGTVVIDHNDVTAEGPGARGINFFNDKADAATSALIMKNTVTLGGGADAGLLLSCGGTMVRNNKVLGAAVRGIYANESAGLTFVGNNLATLTSDVTYSFHGSAAVNHDNSVRGFTGGLDSVDDETDDPFTPQYDGANFLTGVTPMAGAGGAGPDMSSTNGFFDDCPGPPTADDERTAGGERQE